MLSCLLIRVLEVIMSFTATFMTEGCKISLCNVVDRSEILYAFQNLFTLI